MSTPLLDPKNDYVFKRLFAEAPDLLLALINDLRPDLPPVTSVEVLNPNIEAGELSGKYIILDVLARDAQGHQYNVEMQVRRYNAWGQRSLYYLARMLSDQLMPGVIIASLKRLWVFTCWILTCSARMKNSKNRRYGGLKCAMKPSLW